MHLLDATGTFDELLGPYQIARWPRPTRSCWVRANMVGGLDGSAAIGGRVGVLSSKADAALFQALRAMSDVVLVGAETVRRERYRPIAVRDEDRATRAEAGRPEVPRLAIVTRSLEFDWSIPAFAEADPHQRPLLITGTSADPARVAEAHDHADVMMAGNGSVDLDVALRGLADLGMRSVLCEGGPHLLGELVAQGHLDELCLTLTPIMGGDPLPIAVAPLLEHTTRFELCNVATDDDVLFLRYERAA